MRAGSIVALGATAVVVVTLLMLEFQTWFLLSALVICMSVVLLLMGSERALVAAPVAALVVLIVVPSSATASFPLGSLYPIFAALGIQIVGLLKNVRVLRQPPFILWMALFLVLQALPDIDPFYMLLLPIGLFQYVLVWSACSDSKRVIRNWIIVLASAEGIAAIIEALSGTGPFIGTVRAMDAMNPFLPGVLRAQGTLAHPLVLALVLLTGLALALAARDIRMRYRVFALATILAGAVFTGSATTVLVAIAILAAFALVRANVGAGVYVGLAMLIVTVVVISANLIPRELVAQLDERATSHRLNAIYALPNLLGNREVAEVLLGSGSIRELYANGVLIDDGFYAVDNQLVSSLATAGILGTIGLVIFSVGVFINTQDIRYRVVLLTFALVGFSFDILHWYAGVALVFTVAAIVQPASAEWPSAPAGGFRERRAQTSAARSTNRVVAAD